MCTPSSFLPCTNHVRSLLAGLACVLTSIYGHTDNALRRRGRLRIATPHGSGLLACRLHASRRTRMQANVAVRRWPDASVYGRPFRTKLQTVLSFSSRTIELHHLFDILVDFLPIIRRHTTHRRLSPSSQSADDRQYSGVVPSNTARTRVSHAVERVQGREKAQQVPS